jgi:hypothetical protein
MAQGVGPEFKPQYHKKKKIDYCVPRLFSSELNLRQYKGFRKEPYSFKRKEEWLYVFGKSMKMS